MFTKITQTQLIVATVLFIALFDNYTFYNKVLEVYPLSYENFGFLLSLVVLLIALNTLVFTLLSSKYTSKAILIFVVLVSSLSNYFMNSYHVVIDADMLRNAIQTNSDEAFDLVTPKQIFYFFFLGILPSLLIYKIPILYRDLKSELFSKAKYIFVSFIVIVLCFTLFNKNYTSFFREHKPLRYNVNPTYWIYAIGDYVSKTFASTPQKLQEIGLDAKVDEPEQTYKELVIVVVGEAARADHFSLNGYKRETNPLLAQEDIINFSNIYSCGTSTAHSVPCMFSILTQDQYSYKKAKATQNILDVLSHTDFIDILWRDNNSDSKGVALRVPYEDFKNEKNNPLCDTECRDEGMLIGLDSYIQAHKGKDILIVLHQMGNHGPAYYKRYPKEFEKFTPTCKTKQLEKCTQEEIINSYDNALLYTDHFLAKTINFLKQYDNTHETALIYMSDHGESLGENGLYLHGLPYFMAPDAQKHIGSFLWLGKEMQKEFPLETLRQKQTKKYSQDNLFHTLLGLFEVETELYEQKKDILHGK